MVKSIEEKLAEKLYVLIIGIIAISCAYGLYYLIKWVGDSIPKFEYVCGRSDIKTVELICEDGYVGCSRKYIFIDGGEAIFFDGASRQNENGQLCLKKEII